MRMAALSAHRFLTGASKSALERRKTHPEPRQYHVAQEALMSKRKPPASPTPRQPWMVTSRQSAEEMDPLAFYQWLDRYVAVICRVAEEEPRAKS